MEDAKMRRFLEDMGIANPEAFDLSFDRVLRDPKVQNKVIFHIRKTRPWEQALLEEFLQGLSALPYPYDIHFSYDAPIGFAEVSFLFDDWRLAHHMNLSLSLKEAEGEMLLECPNEEKMESYRAIVGEFNDFLTFLGYPSPIILKKRETKNLFEEEEEIDPDSFVMESLLEPGKLMTPEEVIPAKDEEEAPKPVEEPKPEPIPEPKVEEPEPEEEKEEEPEEDESDRRSKAEADALEEYHQSLKWAQEEYLSSIQTEKLEASKNHSIYHKGDYQYIENLNSLFEMPLGNVEIGGDIFDLNVRTVRGGRLFATFGLGSPTGAIKIRCSEEKLGLSRDVINELKDGQFVAVRGSLENDQRNGNMRQVFAHYIDQLPPHPLRDDPEEEKRVELHLHTNMSQMDGIPDVADYIKLAKHMGHKAIAVTDHGVIQSFPGAETAGKAEGIKILYGCEFYMFDDPKPAFGNITDLPLKDGRYCVFDFETTGLSHKYDRPIEFGGVIIENGMVSKHLDLFIDPEMDLSESKAAMAINRITEDDLRGAPKMKEAILTINEFIGDAVLVSHNAPFDISFLNMMRHEAGLGDYEGTVIDTLSVAKYIFADAQSLREESLAKRLGIFDESEGKFHRADYDAEILSRIWLQMIPLLSSYAGKQGITVRDLLSLPHPGQNFYKHQKAFHVIAMAKNQEGIKSLYRLVSESETTYLAPQSGGIPTTPKVPRSFLQENRENLLLGSACMNGLVFEHAMNGTDQDLEREMAFYDYIEIQPKENYSFLTNIGDLSERRLSLVMKRLVDAADKLGKILVATGDCHYLNPEDKIARDVYIFADGLGKTRHPLNPFYRQNRGTFENPDQHYRSTREMLDSFRSWLPEEKCREIVITNTNRIADMVDSDIKILKDRLYTPDANLPGSAEKLRELCYKTLHDTYGENPDPKVKARLDRELDGIIGNGYAVTYWIAHLLVKKAAEDGYFIGSRGSVGSSFAATMAGITEVNPLAPHYLCPNCHHFEWANDDPEFKHVRSGFDLPHKKCPVCGHELKKNGQSIPFEIFLGFNADKVPDIDLNFPADYQSRGHDYTRELLSTPEENEKIKKGEFIHSPHVIRAGTISTSADRNAFGYVKHYYETVKHQELTPETRVYASYLAKKCVGVKRTTGQHPGGIVVIPADMDIFDFTPFQHPADDPQSTWLTTHYEFANMHDSVLKLDELGHVDPVALRMQCLMAGIHLDKVEDEIPMDDKNVLSLFSSPKALKMRKNPLKFKTGAVALPEFGTSFVQGLLEEALPKTFNDLLIISGLSHGTDVWNNNAQELVKDGRTLDQVVGCRDDIMNYLISVGVDPSMAFRIMEDVRKGKGKFQKNEATYVPAMREKGVPDWYIDSLRKIQYLFPRAHATAYVIGAVRVAWFKLYHPLEFYATYFSTRCDHFDVLTMSQGYDAILAKIQEIQGKNDKGEASDVELDLLKTLTAAIEMVDRGYIIQNVSLMESDVNEWLVDHDTNSIIPPFKAIAGFDTNSAEKIAEARKAGAFLSKGDIKDRSGVGDAAIKLLDAVGALEGLGETNQMSLFDFGF